MKSKPNPFLHMMGWGFVSGIVLAMLFSVFILFRDNTGLLAFILDAGLGFSGLIIMMTSLIYGGIPGLILGFIDGLILWLIMRGRPLPFGREDMQAARWSVYAWLGSLTLIGGYLLIMSVAQESFFEIIFNIIGFLPPIIAAIASAYAGHRYLFRLRLWSEQSYGLRKEKAKNDALGRLEDKPQNESYLSLDEALENEQQL